MTKATLTPAQIGTMLSLRGLNPDDANPIRAALFSQIKAAFGIPDADKLTVDLDSVGSPLYGMLIRKKTGLAYGLTDGRFVGNYQDPVATAPAATQTPMRWFHVERDYVAGAIASNYFWGDGDDERPLGTQLTPGTDDSGFDVIVDSDGDMFIQLPESEF